MPLPHKPPLHGYNQLSVNQTCSFSSLSSKPVDIKSAENKIIPAICQCVSRYNSLQLICSLPNSFSHVFSPGQVLLISILAFVNLASMLSKCTYKFNLIKGLHGKLSSSITHILVIKLCMFFVHFYYLFIILYFTVIFLLKDHTSYRTAKCTKGTYNIYSPQLLSYVHLFIMMYCTPLVITNYK